MNAFSKSVALELEPFGVGVRIVIPGRAPETPFGENARGRMGMNIPEPYTGVAAQIFARFQAGGAVTYSRDVAEAARLRSHRSRLPDAAPSRRGRFGARCGGLGFT